MAKHSFSFLSVLFGVWRSRRRAADRLAAIAGACAIGDMADHAARCIRCSGMEYVETTKDEMVAGCCLEAIRGDRGSGYVCTRTGTVAFQRGYVLKRGGKTSVRVGYVLRIVEKQG